jgi:hypothetical protein
MYRTNSVLGLANRQDQHTRINAHGSTHDTLPKMAPKFLYTVTASIPQASTAARYVEWLTQGTPSHIQEVIAGGALSATVAVSRLDQMTIVESRYVFPSAQAFAAYEAGPAVALRAAGVALFGPTSGANITFSRSTAELIATA